MKGLIHIYCGDGKGKTTSSLGLALRAVGNGMKVKIVQFLKTNNTSEYKSIRNIDGIDIVVTQEKEKFVFQMNDKEKDDLYKTQNDILNETISNLKNIDMLIFDEILGAIETKTIDENILKSFIVNKPDNIELVLTGRNVDDFYINKADYVSVINCKKHPYEKGISARKGIEY